MSAQDYTVIRDQNRIPIWWGISSVDGVTPIPISIDGTTGKPLLENGTSVMPVMAQLKDTVPRDGNRIPCVSGLSSTDSSRIIPVSVNPATGAIQVQNL